MGYHPTISGDNMFGVGNVSLLPIAYANYRLSRPLQAQRSRNVSRKQGIQRVSFGVAPHVNGFEIQRSRSAGKPEVTRADKKAFTTDSES